MSAIRVVFYQESNGKAPVLEWLKQLRRKNLKAWANWVARIELLSQFGDELRRPAADYLRDGVYELRAKHGHVQYRLLCCFHARGLGILMHAVTKRDVVPEIDIERAQQRKEQFFAHPEGHTYEEEYKAD
jgi:phage-related protein